MIGPEPRPLPPRWRREIDAFVHEHDDPKHVQYIDEDVDALEQYARDLLALCDWIRHERAALCDWFRQRTVKAQESER